LPISWVTPVKLLHDLKLQFPSLILEVLNILCWCKDGKVCPTVLRLRNVFWQHSQSLRKRIYCMCVYIYIYNMKFIGRFTEIPISVDRVLLILFISLHPRPFSLTDDRDRGGRQLAVVDTIITCLRLY